MLDSWGDGWSLGNSPHGFEIISNDQTIYSYAAGNFGLNLTKSNIMTTTALGIGTNETALFGIYPNPSTGIIRINTETPVQVSIIDILGKVVFTATDVTSETEINLSGFQKGMYLAKIAGENHVSTEKIILK
jgi:hypothetical protein